MSHNVNAKVKHKSHFALLLYLQKIPINLNCEIADVQMEERRVY